MKVAVTAKRSATAIAAQAIASSSSASCTPPWMYDGAPEWALPSSMSATTRPDSVSWKKGCRSPTAFVGSHTKQFELNPHRSLESRSIIVATTSVPHT